MIIPTRATVRPRAVCPETGDCLPLDELVAAAIDRRQCGAIEVTGGPGSGKTAALGHLAAVLCPGKPLLYLDDASFIDVESAKGMRIVVYATRGTQASRTADESFPLAGWREDECIEYLMARHPKSCGSVINRLREADRSSLAGSPELYRIVLDRMAVDESANEPDDIILARLVAGFPDPDQYSAAQEYALSILRELEFTAEELRDDLLRMKTDLDVLRLLRHRTVQCLLATERLATALAVGDVGTMDGMPRELLGSVARQIRGSAAAFENLQAMLTDEFSWIQSLAASILHATQTDWQPKRDAMPSLEHAQLAGAQWPDIDLSAATLICANLTHANLRKAKLSAADGPGCNLAGANLEGADLSGANLNSANLTRANLQNGTLRDTKLSGAALTSASFHDAWLTSADLRGAKIEDADFSLATLTFATLDKLPLREARFTGAVFTKASLVECDMEGMRLPRADFQCADLRRALLTGAVVRRANFRNASLRGAGLAEIDLEGSDLRDADLRESSFYLGSSRSGLVGSPLACEGSRTGFYTDDFDDQTYKAPEEIRKANMCGVDLRGAKIEGVDFYLVDLRDAQYTPDQEKHLRACGAILFERAGR